MAVWMYMYVCQPDCGGLIGCVRHVCCRLQNICELRARIIINDSHMQIKTLAGVTMVD
jgi:hypothetical protein